MIAIVGSSSKSGVSILKLSVNIFLDAKKLFEGDDVVSQLDVLLLESVVVVLELVQVLFQGSDSLVGSVDIILKLSFHSFDVSRSLNDISFHLFDLVLESFIGSSSLVQVVQDTVSLGLDGSEQFGGGLGDLELASEIVELVGEVVVVSSFFSQLLVESSNLVVQLVVLGSQVSLVLLESVESLFQVSDLVAKTVESIGVSSLGSQVIVSGLLELSLVDFTGVNLSSEFVVFVLELSILNFHGVELSLDVIDGVVGSLQLTENVAVVSFQIEDDLVELGSFTLKFLGGFEQSLSQFFSGVGSIFVFFSEIVNFSLPSFLVSELEVQSIDDVSQVFQLVLVLVDVSSGLGVHQQRGHIWTSFSGVWRLASSGSSVVSTSQFGWGSSLVQFSGDLSGSGESGTVSWGNQRWVDELGVSHLRELVQVEAVGDLGEIGIDLSLSFSEMLVNHSIEVVVQFGFGVLVTSIGRSTIANPSVDWAGGLLGRRSVRGSSLAGTVFN